MHDLLLSEGIWLWKRGAIEEHLGITDKSERAWLDYKIKLAESNDWKAVVEDHQEVSAVFDWLYQ